MYADRVLEISSTTGTGSVTLAGAVAGFRTFNAAVGTDRTFPYCIEAVSSNDVPTGEWEIGNGHLSGATTLVRRMVYKSSNADAAVSFAAGRKRVFICDPSHSARTSGQSDAHVNNWGMP